MGSSKDKFRDFAVAFWLKILSNSFFTNCILNTDELWDSLLKYSISQQKTCFIAMKTRQ